jgi:hypothetical protein
VAGNLLMGLGQISSREIKQLDMGQFSDLPRDVIWLILRHAIYADYRYPENLIRVICGLRSNFSVPVDNADTRYRHSLIHVLNRYARVSQRCLSVIRSKLRGTKWCLDFVNNAWSNFKP